MKLVTQAIGQSHLGQTIHLTRFRHESSGLGKRLFVGGVHGDEPEGVYFAEHLLQWAQSQLQHGHDVQAWSNWDLITCLNPDGYQSLTRTNSAGADLNRNFPEPNWTLGGVGGRYFSGTSPASEPETRALVHLMKIENYDLIVHFHSWKPCLVLSGDDPLWVPYSMKLAERLSIPYQEDIGYPTPGSLGEYGKNVLKTPVICIEIPEGLSRKEVLDFGATAFELLIGEADL